MKKRFAAPQGYTKPIVAHGDGIELDLLVKPDTDLNACFVAYERALNKMMYITKAHYQLSV